MQIPKRFVPANTEKSRYDLSTTDADYPDWEADKPFRSYVLCTHTRSGSTLLSEAMYQAGGMGCPVEYFHLGFQPTLMNMWDANDLDSYIQAVYKHRTDPSGSFGTKIFWMDVIDLCVEHYPHEAELMRAELGDCVKTKARVYEMVKNLFEKMFPNPRYIFLTRQDRLRHAISSLISGQVKIFRDISGAKKPAPAGEPVYDYDRILTRIRYYAYCDMRWNEFFQSAGIEPYRLFYEDLSTDYENTVRDMIVSLEVAVPDMEIQNPRLRRQASRLSEEFALRFLSEHMQRAAETELS